MQDIAIARYSKGDEAAWNDFVLNAKNSTFLFNRKYMDYHSDRFTDHSVLIYLRGKLSAVMAANEDGEIISSHAGLSYGGMILLPDARLEDVLAFFYHTVRYYHQSSFKYLRYKTFPSYLTSFPSYEDQYALFRLGSQVKSRGTSSVIVSEAALPYQKGRKSSLKKAPERNFAVEESTDPAIFWNQVLIPNLDKRFGAKPIHTAAEMKLLMDRFPDNIKLYHISREEVVAGSVVYVFPNAVHTQYLSATQKGKDHGALDVLIDHLVTKIFAGKSYFSFGISDDGSGGLNMGLHNWKEGFGARTHILDQYEIDTSHYKLLEQYG